MSTSETITHSSASRPDKGAPPSVEITAPIRQGSRTGAQRQTELIDNADSDIHDVARVSEVAIGGFRIGPRRPCMIVAEAGVNHNGSRITALSLVDAAADAGADAVKFQMFRAADLVTATASTAEYQRRATGVSRQREMLARLELALDDFAAIQTYCQQRGIMFLATPFSPMDAARIAGLGAPAIKIASTDATNEPLLKAALASKRPLILSTGAASADEIRAAVSFMISHGAAKRLVLLHCVSRYPTPINEINLGAIRTLCETYSLPVGLSDHTTSTDVGGWAVAAGACVLEKHLTLDAAADGPDHAMSLTPDQFAVYVALARQAQKAVGDGAVGMTAGQTEVRQLATRSIVTAMDISAGDSIERNMVTLKRPGTGIPARRLEDVVGRIARAPIPRDTILSWDMLR